MRPSQQSNLGAVAANYRVELGARSSVNCRHQNSMFALDAAEQFVNVQHIRAIAKVSHESEGSSLGRFDHAGFEPDELVVACRPGQGITGAETAQGVVARAAAAPGAWKAMGTPETGLVPLKRNDHHRLAFDFQRYAINFALLV